MGTGQGTRPVCSRRRAELCVFTSTFKYILSSLYNKKTYVPDENHRRWSKRRCSKQLLVVKYETLFEHKTDIAFMPFNFIYFHPYKTLRLFNYPLLLYHLLTVHRVVFSYGQSNCELRVILKDE